MGGIECMGSMRGSEGMGGMEGIGGMGEENFDLWEV